MKKKGSFLSGLVVFILIIIILGGVGYLGFNIIKNANSMTSMNMASDTTSDTSTSETANTNFTNETTSTSSETSKDAESAYKISQINQIMLNKAALDKAYATINSALQKMTLDPYAANSDSSSSMSDQMNSQTTSDTQSTTSNDSSQDSTTVNVYTGSVTDQQTTLMQSMGQTYDADKMQQLHSGLYKVSVGMQLLKQLQNDIAVQIEKAGVDTSSEAEFYISQYYKTVQHKNNLDDALTYINEAVDLININPYVDGNGLVYDANRMTQLHDSIYLIAQGVVDLNKLNNDFLSQSVDLGALAQNAYNEAQLAIQTSTETTMNMTTDTTSNLNVSNIISIVLIAFVVIFIIGLLGSILNLFKSSNKNIPSNNL